MHQRNPVAQIIEAGLQDLGEAFAKDTGDDETSDIFSVSAFSESSDSDSDGDAHERASTGSGSPAGARFARDRPFSASPAKAKGAAVGRATQSEQKPRPDSATDTGPPRKKHSSRSKESAEARAARRAERAKRNSQRSERLQANETKRRTKAERDSQREAAKTRLIEAAHAHPAAQSHHASRPRGILHLVHLARDQVETKLKRQFGAKLRSVSLLESTVETLEREVSSVKAEALASVQEQTSNTSRGLQHLEANFGGLREELHVALDTLVPNLLKEGLREKLGEERAQITSQIREDRFASEKTMRAQIENSCESLRKDILSTETLMPVVKVDIDKHLARELDTAQDQFSALVRKLQGDFEERVDSAKQHHEDTSGSLKVEVLSLVDQTLQLTNLEHKRFRSEFERTVNQRVTSFGSKLATALEESEQRARKRHEEVRLETARKLAVTEKAFDTSISTSKQTTDLHLANLRSEFDHEVKTSMREKIAKIENDSASDKKRCMLLDESLEKLKTQLEDDTASSKHAYSLVGPRVEVLGAKFVEVAQRMASERAELSEEVRGAVEKMSDRWGTFRADLERKLAAKLDAQVHAESHQDLLNVVRGATVAVGLKDGPAAVPAVPSPATAAANANANHLLSSSLLLADPHFLSQMQEKMKPAVLQSTESAVESRLQLFADSKLTNLESLMRDKLNNLELKLDTKIASTASRDELHRMEVNEAERFQQEQSAWRAEVAKTSKEVHALALEFEKFKGGSILESSGSAGAGGSKTGAAGAGLGAGPPAGASSFATSSFVQQTTSTSPRKLLPAPTPADGVEASAGGGSGSAFRQAIERLLDRKLRVHNFVSREDCKALILRETARAGETEDQKRRTERTRLRTALGNQLRSGLEDAMSGGGVVSAGLSNLERSVEASLRGLESYVQERFSQQTAEYDGRFDTVLQRINAVTEEYQTLATQSGPIVANLGTTGSVTATATASPSPFSNAKRAGGQNADSTGKVNNNSALVTASAMKTRNGNNSLAQQVQLALDPNSMNTMIAERVLPELRRSLLLDHTSEFHDTVRVAVQKELVTQQQALSHQQFKDKFSLQEWQAKLTSAQTDMGQTLQRLAENVTGLQARLTDEMTASAAYQKNNEGSFERMAAALDTLYDDVLVELGKRGRNLEKRISRALKSNFAPALVKLCKDPALSAITVFDPANPPPGVDLGVDFFDFEFDFETVEEMDGKFASWRGRLGPDDGDMELEDSAGVPSSLGNSANRVVTRFLYGSRRGAGPEDPQSRSASAGKTADDDTDDVDTAENSLFQRPSPDVPRKSPPTTILAVNQGRQRVDAPAPGPLSLQAQGGAGPGTAALGRNSDQDHRSTPATSPTRHFVSSANGGESTVNRDLPTRSELRKSVRERAKEFEELRKMNLGDESSGDEGVDHDLQDKGEDRQVEAEHPGSYEYEANDANADVSEPNDKESSAQSRSGSPGSTSREKGRRPPTAETSSAAAEDSELRHGGRACLMSSLRRKSRELHRLDPTPTPASAGASLAGSAGGLAGGAGVVARAAAPEEQGAGEVSLEPRTGPAAAPVSPAGQSEEFVVRAGEGQNDTGAEPDLEAEILGASDDSDDSSPIDVGSYPREAAGDDPDDDGDGGEDGGDTSFNLRLD